MEPTPVLVAVKFWHKVEAYVKQSFILSKTVDEFASVFPGDTDPVFIKEAKDVHSAFQSLGSEKAAAGITQAELDSYISLEKRLLAGETRLRNDFNEDWRIKKYEKTYKSATTLIEDIRNTFGRGWHTHWTTEFDKVAFPPASFVDNRRVPSYAQVIQVERERKRIDDWIKQQRNVHIQLDDTRPPPTQQQTERAQEEAQREMRRQNELHHRMWSLARTANDDDTRFRRLSARTAARYEIGQ